jgi:L-serine dehydratase
MYVNVFNIIGPVMVGPSSSHTAGAVRIGKIARIMLGETLDSALIKLHGSFARTYRGHGTDRAIVGGLLGMEIDDGRLGNSLEIAANAGLSCSFEFVSLKDAHPNTAVLELTGVSGKKLSITGASVGGGNIVIKSVDGLDVNFNGQYNTLVIQHMDTPGTIASVTNLLAQDVINIAQMKVYRSDRGGCAIMVIEADQELSSELTVSVNHLPNIIKAVSIKPL